VRWPLQEGPCAVPGELDQAVIEAQRATYPLTTCLVTGKKLGSMGAPREIVVGNRLVRLCCGGCVKAATKDAAATIARLDQAVLEARWKSYPLTTCVVSGEKLGGMGRPVEYVHGTRLVRLCCGGCVAKLEKDPASFLAKIDQAAPGRAESRPGEAHGETHKDH